MHLFGLGPVLDQRSNEKKNSVPAVFPPYALINLLMDVILACLFFINHVFSCLGLYCTRFKQFFHKY